MNPANIIYYLSRLFDVDFSLKVQQISETERLAAQELAAIIRSIISCEQIDYEDEITLDFTIEKDRYCIEDNFILNTSRDCDSDDEWHNEENLKENHQLKNYSI
ncbi:unnamed protein product [Rotaria magnacalcarata]|uniref:Uncharacterized protein n=1 Tax=Rotaria magnacalcarata TaxID=392030 RepID=A0A816LMQ7_9BILA|nr:unnamed protein product [Rotaria magnacalcarata]CAF1576174.1 unnamed protein product [Rotaria magnacalcarata]CAF1948317.1 unnamed protein product [Rotaria magnacalcarata]CAF4125648.1 unnamed protein product [Rotaria magnacalcarata]CAF4157476.1 unnamed protein product [Rotaria magnacalcarata]